MPLILIRYFLANISPPDMLIILLIKIINKLCFW
uniref:Uncharacterized protein n=1 Tax=Arundo donax TaxID=35708 RepID=A0A0A9GMT6_ARUDO